MREPLDHRQVMQAAAHLIRSYFLPMAARVLGDASVPAEGRNARTLAEWVMHTRPAAVNVSSIRNGRGCRACGRVTP